MSQIKQIIENYNGDKERSDYKELVNETSLDDEDIAFFETVINYSKYNGTAEWDWFMDNGGLEIAAILLEEVKRIRRGLVNVLHP